MNSVALMVALMSVPESAAFGNKCGGGGCDPCGSPCGKTGLFGGRIRAFFAKCNLFNKCRSKNACWSPPAAGGCCGMSGGYDMGGFDGMPTGGMPVSQLPGGDGFTGASGFPTEMAMGGMPTGGMPMNSYPTGMSQPGGNCPGCAAQRQQQIGGYPQQQFGSYPQQQFNGYPQQQFNGYQPAMSQPMGGAGVTMVQGGEFGGSVQPSYTGQSAYPQPMPAQPGYPSQPATQPSWGSPPQQGGGQIGPILGAPTQPPAGSGMPPVPVPSPIPQNGPGVRVPFGAFPGASPASAVSPAHATGGEDFAPAKLRFQVPVGAVVYVDGQKVDGTGPVRKFHTPTLPRGKTFFYEFKAEMVVNGLKVVEEKVLPVCAGDDLTETFAKLAVAAK